jgi:glycosyltransferase involved in cell wall biosynthesis
MPLTLALSVLCENPRQRTGLTTLFHEFVAHALCGHPEVHWIIFAGLNQAWSINDERVTIVREFPSNERRSARLFADHFRVPAAARRRGAAALLTVGFMPWRAAGLPIVMHVFSLHHRRGGGPRGIYRRIAVENGLRSARLVIANSQWTADHLGPTRAPVCVSYEGLQRDRFSSDGTRGMAGQPQEYFLWVSNFYGYKRAELALAAYARLSPELRARFPFLLVGGDWEGGGGRAKAAAHALGIKDNVRFLGWVNDEQLPALYRGARAYILSTAEETFGRSVVEAMACGCPCVLQDLPVLREVTSDGALFTQFTDTNAAAEALRRVCTDDELAGHLRAMGLRRAAAFSFEKLANERMAAIIAAIQSAP